MLLKNVVIGEVCKHTVIAKVFSNIEQSNTHLKFTQLAEPVLLCRVAQTLQPTNIL